MCDDKYTNPFKEIAADMADEIFGQGYEPHLSIADMLHELVSKISELAEKEKQNRCSDIDFAVKQLIDIAVNMEKANK